MKKHIIIPICMCIVVFFIMAPAFSAERGIKGVTWGEAKDPAQLYKDYQALVIGVGDYEYWPKLPNAVGDAYEVAEKLESLGFGVRKLLDPTSDEMLKALNEMVYTMGQERNRGLILYYAGHGETETLADNSSIGYIIPKDCPLLNENPIGFSKYAVSMKTIESVSLRIKSKHVLMLFDSCFSGSLFNLVRARPHDISEKSLLPVRQYITAGSANETVPDKSVFKKCFMIGLDGDADLTQDGFITGSELGMYLSDRVVNYTRSGQHPQYGKINNPELDRGDFIFITGKKKAQYAASPKEKKEEASQDTNLLLVRELEKMRKEMEGLRMEMMNRTSSDDEPQARDEDASKTVASLGKTGKYDNRIDDFETKLSRTEKDLRSGNAESGEIREQVRQLMEERDKLFPQLQKHMDVASVRPVYVTQYDRQGLYRLRSLSRRNVDSDNSEKIAALKRIDSRKLGYGNKLLVTSNIEGATVSIGKAGSLEMENARPLYQGKTPCSVTDLEPGEYQVKISLEGYGDVLTTINIGKDSTLNFHTDYTKGATPVFMVR